MKHIFRLSLLFLLVQLFLPRVTGQNTNMPEVPAIQKDLVERITKILSVLPESSPERNTHLAPYPDTIISLYDNAAEELVAFSYAEINGEILPVSVTYIYVPANEISTIAFEYDSQNRLVRGTGTAVLEEGEEDITITFEYDAFGIRVSQTIATFSNGFPIEFIERVLITRDGHNQPVDLIKEEGIFIFGFGEMQRTVRVSEITYQNDVPVSFISSNYFFDATEELDSTSIRFSDVRWYRYEDQLLNMVLNSEEFTELTSADFIPSPTNAHIEQMIAGNSEVLINGEWEFNEAIILNNVTNTEIDITIESWLNRREVYSLDENGLLLQKDLYYGFDDEVSEREIYTYTDFQREATYQKFRSLNEELVLELATEKEYTFDGNSRLVLLTEKSNAEAERTTLFRYSGSTSSKETPGIPSDIRIFPNPALSTVNVWSEEWALSDMTYSIYDINGKIVQSSPRSFNSSPIDVSGLGTGMYILQVRNAGQIATMKFTKL